MGHKLSAEAKALLELSKKKVEEKKAKSTEPAKSPVATLEAPPVESDAVQSVDPGSLDSDPHPGSEITASQDPPPEGIKEPPVAAPAPRKLYRATKFFTISLDGHTLSFDRDDTIDDPVIAKKLLAESCPIVETGGVWMNCNNCGHQQPVRIEEADGA